MKHFRILRYLCVLLALCLLGGCFVGCSQDSEIPDGYQYATCRGEYFRLFIPTQWTVNTESGVSGGHYSPTEGIAVSMTEVPFEKPASEDGAPDTTATLDDFFAHHMAQLATMNGYAPEKELDSSLNGKRAKDITYAAKVGSENYRFRQVLSKVEGRFYLFTFSAVESSFDRWLDTVDGILENVMFYAYPYEGSSDEKKLPSVEAPAGMKLITGNDVAYRFFAPNDWVVGNADAAALVYASETDRSNVTVMGYVPEEESYSVADYWEDTEKYYRDALKEYTLTATTQQTMGGKRATVYEYSYSLGGVTYKCRQTVCVYSYMIVIMTYTALPENYEAHLDDVQLMQESLTFRTPVIG